MYLTVQSVVYIWHYDRNKNRCFKILHDWCTVL